MMPWCLPGRSCANLNPRRGAQVADDLVEVIALILLPVAVLMCAYALTVFVWRSRAIAKKTVRPRVAQGHTRWTVFVWRSRAIAKKTLRQRVAQGHSRWTFSRPSCRWAPWLGAGIPKYQYYINF